MRILLALAILSLVLLVAPVRVHTESPGHVPVLLYHNLTTDAASGDATTVPVREFAAQMAWLAAHGYTPITSEELGDWLAAGQDLPSRPVLVTFDDGYASNYDLAFPILKRYGIRATIFVVSSATGETPGHYPHLTAAQMREMQASGLVEFQAHSHDGHRLIDGVPALVAESQPEIATDLDALEAAFADDGINGPTAFAYPFGAYDDEVLRALEEDGFRLGFTVEQGYVQPGDNPLTLKRLIIFPGISICRFAEIVEGRAPGGACPP